MLNCNKLYRLYYVHIVKNNEWGMKNGGKEYGNDELPGMWEKN